MALFLGISTIEGRKSLTQSWKMRHRSMTFWTGETKIVVDVDKDGEVGFVLRTRSKFASNARWNMDVLDFYASCKHLFCPTFPRNPCQSTHVIEEMARHFAATHITGAKAQIGRASCRER